MEEKAKEARRAYNRVYQKKWRAAHPDKVRAAQARYWAKKAEESAGTEAGTAADTQ